MFNLLMQILQLAHSYKKKNEQKNVAEKNFADD